MAENTGRDWAESKSKEQKAEQKIGLRKEIRVTCGVGAGLTFDTPAEKVALPLL